MSLAARRWAGRPQPQGPPSDGDTTPPSAPTSFGAVATGPTTAALSWGASTDNVGVTGYRIYRGGTQIGTSTTPYYADYGLTATTAYSYYVKAVDAAGNTSAASSTASVTTSAAGFQVGIDFSSNGIESKSLTLQQEIQRQISSACLDLSSAASPKLGNHAKFYDSGDNSIWSSWSSSVSSGYDGTPVLCHKMSTKGVTNANLTSNAYYGRVLDALTAPVVWVYWQEFGYDKPGQSSVSYADYNLEYQHMDYARRHHPNGRFVLLCMNGSTSQELNHEGWQNCDPTSANVDYIAMDTYRATSKQNSNWPASTLFQYSSAWHNALTNNGTALHPYPNYKGPVIPEYGTARAPAGTDGSSGNDIGDTAMKGWIKGDIEWLQSNGYIWVNYWNEDNHDANSNWAITDPSRYTATIAYVNGQITR